MKASLNWLTDYVDIPMPASELAELLTRIGLAVEDVEETPTDIVLDVEVTSNRPDCLGHIGLAREIAAALGTEFRPPQIPDLPAEGKIDDLTSVEVREPDLCPRYTARVIGDVKVGPSPTWLVERLEAVGLRSINNVVDVTNYVLMEYSQPLHAFDYDKLAENRILVRRAQNGETLTSIDQTLCKLDDSMLIIADAKKPVAVAGIMGGLDTEVGDATTNVLIESAQFDPLVTRRTSRKLALMSESNYRFERGVDPVGTEEASRRACQLILDLAGGQLVGGLCDAWANPYTPPKVTLRPERTHLLLGLDIDAGKQQKILSRLGLSPRNEDGRIVCDIPAYRPDLRREVDLIEEIGRLNGYDAIEVRSTVSHRVTAAGQWERLRKSVGRAMSAQGFDEALTFTFVGDDEAKLLGFEKLIRVDRVVRRSDNVLRPTVVMSLLRACKKNQDVGNENVHLYELARAFPAAGDGELPAEYTELAMASTGELRDLRGAVEAVCESLTGNADLELRRCSRAGLAEDAAVDIHLDGESIGWMGLVSEAVRDHYGLENAPAVASLNFDLLSGHALETRTYAAIPRFPSVRRDLSLILDEEVTYQQLRDAVEAVDQPLRVGMDYVTTYRGKPIPDGRKSVTVRLEYRSDEGTLRREQVDERVDELLSVLSKELGAELRD
ncbi:MAG: phenylalanine--tRNA ligase subunit beta [Phycisphaerae bacterium]